MEILRSGPTAEAVEAPRHRALGSITRTGILRLLHQREAGLTAGEVASAMDLHLTTVREHLDTLADAGLVTKIRRRDGTPGRPPWVYRAAQKPEPRERSLYRELAGALVGHLARTSSDPRAAGVAAGQVWGRHLTSSGGVATTPAEATQRLVTALDHLGFAPQVTTPVETGAPTVHLRACPFIDLAEGDPDVVCGIHLGVIRGALGAMQAPLRLSALEPFGTPTACVARLRTTASSGAVDRPSTAQAGAASEGTYEPRSESDLRETGHG